MPRLMFVVRDFKEGKGDQEISENLFLERKLSDIARKSEKRRITSLRNSIVKFFPERELFRVRHPIDSNQQEDPGNLDDISITDLNPGFQTDAATLRDKLLESTPFKQVWSRRIDA